MVILQLEHQPLLIQAIFSGDIEDVRCALEFKQDINHQDCEKRSALHAASFRGDTEVAAILLSHGARVNTKDNRWITPLHRACCCGSSDLVSLLLKHQADITARDRQWQTPLHVAAANNAVGCVAQLLNCVPNPNVTDRMGRTALHHAAVNGHNDVAELLLSKGCIVNACDKKDCRPIHCAAHMGHVETIELLLRSGADINAKDRNQYSPLHVAAASGMVSACRVLLRSGAEIDAKNAYGNTPLHIACLNGHVPVCNVLVSFNADPEAVNYRGQTPLHIAAASTHGVDCLNFLVDHKVNINKQSLDGRSPLHMTAIHGRFTRSKTLIDKGAIVDSVDKNGCTALHIAAQYGHDLLSNTLLTYGADPSKRGYAGRTPLHMSCLSGYVECCRKFLQVGVDLNAQDDSGKTPIHCAAYKGSVECLDLLVSNGANFHILDKIGRTPLHYAAVQGHYPCVFTLVGLGSNVNLCDGEGCSPLHLAAAYDLKGECVEYLLRHKADPKLKDKKGFTPIHYAVAGENFAGLGFLLSAVGNNYMMYGSDMPLITPLHLAAKSGNLDILRLLLSYFHDTNIRTDQGSTSLLLAAKSGHTHCVQMLLRFGAKVGITDTVYYMSPVHFSARNGHMHCLALLLDNAEDKRVIDLHDSLQRTPLMLAVAGGHTESALTLLKCGADPNIVDADKHSSLFRAVVNGQHSTVQLLISHGALVNKPDIHGKTVLHLAAACAHLSSLQTILKTMDPSDVIAVDNQECTPLHWACYHGNPSCVSFLLEKDIFKELKGNSFSPIHCATFVGAERCIDLICTYFGAETVKLKDARNRTPLHIAALHGHVDCAKYLLEKGAEIECKDTDGRTPLVAAAQNGQSQIIELLISYKADMTSYDNNGNTALHLACLKRHSHAALLLLENIDHADTVNMINNDRKTPLHLSARNGLVNVTRQLISKGSSVLAIDGNGMTPALCCAPNTNVAQCLALILANYAMCSQQNNTKDPSSFTLCPYPRDMCLLFRNKLCKKVKIYGTKVSQTDLSLLREPDYFELHRTYRRQHSPNRMRKRVVEMKPKLPGLMPKSCTSWKTMFAEPKSVQEFLKCSHSPSNKLEPFWKPRIDNDNKNDYFIMENFKSEDQNRQTVEKNIGLDLHRSYSDMFIAPECNYNSTEIVKNAELDSKLNKNIKILDPKLRHNTRTLQNRLELVKGRNQYGWLLDGPLETTKNIIDSNETEVILKETIHQLISSYGSNMNIAQLLHMLIQTIHKLIKVPETVSGSSILLEQNNQMTHLLTNSLNWLDEFENEELNQLLTETMHKIHEQQVDSILESYELYPHHMCEKTKSNENKNVNFIKESKKTTKTFARQVISKIQKSEIRLQQKKGNLDMQSSSIDGLCEETYKAVLTTNDSNEISQSNIQEILNNAFICMDNVKEIYQSNTSLETEKMLPTYIKPKLKVLDTDDDTVMNVDQVLKEEQLLEAEELGRLHSHQKKCNTRTVSWTDLDMNLDFQLETPEYIIMKGLEIIKSAKALDCITPHLKTLNVLLAKWPDFMSETAEIMKHIIATIQEHLWLERLKNELPQSKEKVTEDVIGFVDADLFALECSEDIQKTAKQLLTKISNLQKGIHIKEQATNENIIRRGNDLENNSSNISDMKRIDFNKSGGCIKKDKFYHSKSTFQDKNNKYNNKDNFRKLQEQEVPLNFNYENIDVLSSRQYLQFEKGADPIRCNNDLGIGKRDSLTIFHVKPLEITACPLLISTCVQTISDEGFPYNNNTNNDSLQRHNFTLEAQDESKKHDFTLEAQDESKKHDFTHGVQNETLIDASFEEHEQSKNVNAEQKINEHIENKANSLEQKSDSCSQLEQKICVINESSGMETEETVQIENKQNTDYEEGQSSCFTENQECLCVNEKNKDLISPSDIINGTISFVSYLSVQKEMELTLGALNNIAEDDKIITELQNEEKERNIDLKKEEYHEEIIEVQNIQELQTNAESQNEEENSERNSENSKKPAVIETLYINQNPEQDSVLEEEVINVVTAMEEKQLQTQDQNTMKDYENKQNQETQQLSINDVSGAAKLNSEKVVVQEKSNKSEKKQSNTNVTKKKLKTKEGSHCVIS